MKIIRRERALVAWVLYASLLFALLACALHHGQAVGLQLSGLDGAFCSLGGDSDGAAGHEQGGAVGELAVGLQCPLCAGLLLGTALLAGRAPVWRAGIRRRLRASHARALPRHAWPSLNPRASPLT